MTPVNSTNTIIEDENSELFHVPTTYELIFSLIVKQNNMVALAQSKDKSLGFPSIYADESKSIQEMFSDLALNGLGIKISEVSYAGTTTTTIVNDDASEIRRTNVYYVTNFGGRDPSIEYTGIIHDWREFEEVSELLRKRGDHQSFEILNRLYDTSDYYYNFSGFGPLLTLPPEFETNFEDVFDHSHELSPKTQLVFELFQIMRKYRKAGVLNQDINYLIDMLHRGMRLHD